MEAEQRELITKMIVEKFEGTGLITNSLEDQETQKPSAKPLTEVERKLISRLLKMAAEKFARHGCNDMDLLDIPLEDRTELLRSVAERNGTPEEFDPTRVDYATDWLLMFYFADRVLDSEE